MEEQEMFSSEDAEQRGRMKAISNESAQDERRLEGAADIQRLLHELQVHQIELETQNEELQRARDNAEAVAAKLSDLYDFAPVGYVTLDRNGAISQANLTLANLLGIEQAQLVLRHFGHFVDRPDVSVFEGLLKRVFESRTKHSCELLLLREAKPPVEARVEAVLSKSGQHCYGIVRDITDFKRAEADRLLLSKLESTGILAGGIAHDFNNLLTIMLMNLELAQLLVPGENELGRHLKEAKDAAQLAKGLTHQLITFAKGGAPVFRTMDVSELIRDSVKLALSGSNALAVFTLAGNLWPVEVDAGQLGQVVRNLALNASEAMPKGGVIKVQAENVVLTGQEKVLLPPGQYVQIRMVDQGCGIAKEILPKIFDPYFSSKQRGTQKGMGLGLTICYSIIQKHRGAISVESITGVGSTFSIHLPASGGAVANKPEPKAQLASRPGTILVMDDDEGVRNVFGATLRHLGHAVSLVGNGDKAIEAYKLAQGAGHRFDVVFLDLTVRAGMGGQETIQGLLRLDPAVIAVAMSGYSNHPALLDYEQYGFKGALVKPFDVRNLQELLFQVLNVGDAKMGAQIVA